VLPKYHAQIITAAPEFYVCNATLLAFRFIKGLTADRCIESAWVFPGQTMSTFTQWWLAEVRKKEIKEGTHVSRFMPLKFKIFHDMYLYTVLHESGHIIQKHAVKNDEFSLAEEAEADKFAVQIMMELGYSLEEIWGLFITMRDSARIIRNSMHVPRTQLMNLVFADNLAAIGASFKDKGFIEGITNMLGANRTKEFLRNVEQEIQGK
jgi:hypothetical protein